MMFHTQKLEEENACTNNKSVSIMSLYDSFSLNKLFKYYILSHPHKIHTVKYILKKVQ